MTAGQVTGESTCSPFLQELPVSGVSMSLGLRMDVQSIVAFSDEIAVRLEALQFDLGEGPTVDVIRSGTCRVAEDLQDDALRRLWPLSTIAAIGAGAGALFVFPLLVGTTAIGVVSLHSTTVRASWSASTLDSAERLTRSAAGPAIALATRTAREETGPSGASIELRREVHQASGMVMVQLECSIEEATARLRARAFADDRTVGAVARDVITRRTSFRPGSPQ